MSKKIFSGTILSMKNPKTLIVEVVSKQLNKRYHKTSFVKKKYAVHNEKGIFKNGEVVKFVHSRTYSATKKWEVIS